MNIPLQELYEPIMQLYSQIEAYEKVYDGIQTLNTERAKKQWLIDKVLEHQNRQRILSNEKEQIDAIYRQASLSTEQSNALINQDLPLDDTFFDAYKILIEQGNLQTNLEQYDQGHDNLRNSLLRHMNEIKQLAFSKVNKNLMQHYQQYSPEMLAKLYQMMCDNETSKGKMLEQIEFIQRQEFQSALNLICTQLTTSNESQLHARILTAFQIFSDQLEVETTTLRAIIGEDEQQFKISLHRIVDEVALDCLVKLEKAMNQIKDYYTMFEIKDKITQVVKKIQFSHVIKHEANTFTFLVSLHKLHQSCDVLLQRTLNVFQNLLQSTRFNISVWSSYEPIEEHLARAIYLLESIDQGHRQTIIETLFNPIMTLVTQKLSHNNENRSSKIFSINALGILCHHYTKIEHHYQSNDTEQLQQLDAFIVLQKNQIVELIDVLVKKLHNENLEDVIAKIKFDQIQPKKATNDKEIKDTVRKIVISIMKLDTEVNKCIDLIG